MQIPEHVQGPFLEFALPPGIHTCTEEAGESAVTPGEWDETPPVGAAWGTLGDARQETAVLKDASSSLLSPAYMNTHVFHGLRKPPGALGSRCSVGIAAPVLQH